MVGLSIEVPCVRSHTEIGKEVLGLIEFLWWLTLQGGIR